MLQFDSADLNVLFIGGTGTISASCVLEAVHSGMRVSVLNRGHNSGGRELPDSVETLTADVTDDADLHTAVGSRRYDAVVNFLSYDSGDAGRMVGFFGNRTRQYVHISSGSIYAKPVQQLPITESTPTGPSAHLPYATAKWRAEQTLLAAHRDSGFPLTIVRPSHTYDDANPPLPGGWTTVERIARGAEVPVHGDGTSVWTLTHAEDFARGLVGLLGNPRAVGEIFNITGPDLYTWNQIYTIVAQALGVQPNLVHVASEMYPLVAPDWFWSGEVLDDIGHSAVFDRSKIKTFVPAFDARLTFHRAAHRMVDWRRQHPQLTQSDPGTEEVFDRIVDAYHAARRIFIAHGADVGSAAS